MKCEVACSPSSWKKWDVLAFESLNDRTFERPSFRTFECSNIQTFVKHSNVQTFDCWRYVRGGTDRVIAKAHSHTLGVGRLRRGRSVCGCGATLKLLDALHWQFAHFSFRARHFPTHTPPPQHSHGPRPTNTHCTAASDLSDISGIPQNPQKF